MLNCSAISVTYESENLTISPLVNVNFAVDSGSVALMGPSGSGKSTLLRVIAGLQQPRSGTVSLDGTDVVHRTRDPELDSRISVVHQDYRLVSFLTVRDNLQIARRFKGMTSASPGRIDDVLEWVNLKGYADRDPKSLSGGQRQRVAIARSLLVDARLILADEPTGSLDREASRSIADLLRRVAKEHDCLVVAATHDHDVAERLDRIVKLADLSAAG